ncbi:helix-turn-helix domain-containing protein [Vibrio parahaemolyticus]|uniref:helix-turn-helix domain-containing protein n=1 Tax=Vibrio parahaemolyticus TaxID=670 RepID=UPI0004DF0A7E|nr:helix-turn-helix transcriptional regulator [Vibrio parahaemolyticus]
MSVDMLGINIKQLRKIRGFSQEALAFECDIATSTIQRIEYGKMVPSIKKLHNILSVLGFRLRLERVCSKDDYNNVHVVNSLLSLSDALSSEALRKIEGLVIHCTFSNGSEEAIESLVNHARIEGKIDCVVRAKSCDYDISRKLSM